MPAEASTTDKPPLSEPAGHDLARAKRCWPQVVQNHYGDKLTKRGKDLVMRCPFHNDHHPSLRWNPAKAVWHCDVCEVGGSIVDFIMKREGIDTAAAISKLLKVTEGAPVAPSNVASQQKDDHAADPFVVAPDSEEAAPPRGSAWVARYEYRNPSWKLLAYVDRIEDQKGKRFLPWRWTGSEWINKGLPQPRPLYGLEVLPLPDVPVLVVEGEKAADRASSVFLDYISITSSGGAQQAKCSDWSPLKGRDVVIWPDNDGPGAGYARDVAQLAHAAGAASVRIVIVPDIPNCQLPGWDLGDLPSGFLSTDADKPLMEVLRAALHYAPIASGLGGAEDQTPEPSSGAQAPAGADQLDALTQEILQCLNTDAPLEEVKATLNALSPAAQGRVVKQAATLFKCTAAELRQTLGLASKAKNTDHPDSSALGIRDLEPWEDAVDGAELLDKLRDFYARHVVLPEHGAELLALFSIFSHAYDAFQVSPRLDLSSPVKSCGKSTTLELLGMIVARPLETSNMSPASIYRVVEKYHPTLLCDEFDNYGITEKRDLLGILNSGHHRSGAFVVRCKPDTNEPEKMTTWGVYVFAGLKVHVPETLQSRCIALPMRRKLPTEHVARTNRATKAEGATLGRMAARWVLDHQGQLRQLDESYNSAEALPEITSDRTLDNWQPLLVIAEVVGGMWPGRARAAAMALSSSGPDNEEVGIQLLTDLKRILTEDASPDGGLHTRAILERLGSADFGERPWRSWNRDGSPIDERGLARLLSPYGIASRNVRDPSRQAKGYVLADFRDAFARYLPAEPTTAMSTNSDGGHGQDSPTTHGAGPWDAGTAGTLVSEPSSLPRVRTSRGTGSTGTRAAAGKPGEDTSGSLVATRRENRTSSSTVANPTHHKGFSKTDEADAHVCTDEEWSWE